METSTKLITFTTGKSKRKKESINIGFGIHRLGKKVMLIDLDEDLNLSYKANGQIEDLQKTWLHLFNGEKKPNEILVDQKEIKIIPSGQAFPGSKIEFAGEMVNRNRSKNGMEQLVNSDFISIDCPPGLGIRMLILL